MSTSASEGLRPFDSAHSNISSSVGVLIRGHVSIFNIRFLLLAAKASSIAAPTELSRMSLTSSERNSFNEKALKEQEHNYHRQYNQTRSRHQQIELNPVHRLEVR